jgi:hypothetical protein
MSPDMHKKESGLTAISDLIARSTEEELDALRCRLAIGVHR